MTEDTWINHKNIVEDSDEYLFLYFNVETNALSKTYQT